MAPGGSRWNRTGSRHSDRGRWSFPNIVTDHLPLAQLVSNPTAQRNVALTLATASDSGNTPVLLYDEKVVTWLCSEVTTFSLHHLPGDDTRAQGLQ